MNLHNLDHQFQQTLLNNAVERYQQTHNYWFKEPIVKRAIVIEAVISMQSFVLLTIMVTLSGISLFIVKQSWPVCIIFGLGVLGQLLWLDLNLNNKQKQTKALCKILQPKTTISLDHLHNQSAKVKLFQALRYWSLIEQKTMSLPAGPMHQHLLKTQREVLRWLHTMYQLAQQINTLQLSLINEPQAPGTYGKQSQAQQSTKDKIEQIQQQLDNTLTELSAVYSQIVLITEKNQQRGRTNNLNTEISSEVQRLQDLGEVMNEVYRG